MNGRTGPEPAGRSTRTGRAIDRAASPFDERVLGAGTTARFVLLLVLFVAGSAATTYDLVERLYLFPSNPYGGCLLAAGFNPEAGTGAEMVPTLRYGAALNACWASHVPDVSWIPLVAPLVFIALAAGLYRALPMWKGRRSHVVGLDDADLRRELDALVARAGLTVAPRFVVDPGAATAGAVVFGTRKHPVICLHAGLIVEYARRPERFRAVVLHEFAHIRNGDVAITYATVATWRVFLGAVLPFEAAVHTAEMFTRDDPASWGDTPYYVAKLVQVALIGVLVYLTRADILRTRELYADLTAVRHLGVRREALLPAMPDQTVRPETPPPSTTDQTVRPESLPPGATDLAVQPEPSTPSAADLAVRPESLPLDATEQAVRRDPPPPDATDETSTVRPDALGRANRRTSRAAFAEMWRTHPSWGLRGRSLTDPASLFTLRAVPMFVTGLAAGIASIQLANGYRETYIGGTWLQTVHYLLISALIMAIGGVALWRAAVYALLTGGRVPSGWRTGLWLGAGMAVGGLTNNKIIFGRWPLPHFEVFVIPPVVCALLMAWTAQYAELRVRTCRSRSLRPAMLSGLIAPWLVLAFALLWWDNGGWARGWGLSTSGELARQGLPSTPLLLQITTTLRALPGSDLGGMGLWWAVPLLWLVPLLLWSALPRTTSLKPGSAPPADARRLDRLKPRSARPPGAAQRLDPVEPGSAPPITDAPGMRADVPRWLDRVRPGSAALVADPPDMRRAVRAGLFGGLLCCAGLLAAPLGLDSVRTFHDSRADTQAYMAWIILVIAASMTVTAAVTVLYARDRYPLIRALVAAGITALAGITAQYVKGTADGCLGPMNTLTTECSWRPNRYLTLLENPIGHILGPALLVSALAAALVHAAASRLRRSEPHTPPGPGTRRPRLAAALVVAAAAGLIGTETVNAAFAENTPIPDSELLLVYATPPPASVATQRIQLRNWWKYGGQKVGEDYDTAGRSLAASFAAIVHPRDGQNPVPGFVASIHPACARYSALVRHADEYFPVPIPAGQQLWSRLISTYRATAADCDTLEHATTATNVRTGVITIVDDTGKAAAALRSFSDWSIRLVHG